MKYLKVLWITNIPSPYRLRFFEKLGLSCNLTVIFEKESSDERDLSWNEYEFDNFKGIILSGKSVDVDKSLSLSVIKHIKKNKYDHVVVTNISSPTGIIATEFMRLLKIPYFIEGDGGIAKNGIGIKEKIKKRIISGSRGCFSTGNSHDLYYLKYGAELKNIYRYPFTSIYEKEIIEDVPQYCEKEDLKRELNIKEDFVLLSIGQFIYRKGFDILINSGAHLNSNIGIYIIGGSPTDEYIEMISKYNLTNVHFKKFMSKDSILKWMKASDIFVLPTREDIWGLVINEAMSMGLPIITTDKCIAGLVLIDEGINGFIVPVENEIILAQRISELLADKDFRLKVGRNNISKIKEYTIEKMVSRHIEVFNNV